MSVQHPRLSALLALRQELAGLERRAVSSQDTIRRRMLLQIRKCTFFQWKDFRNSFKHQPTIFDGRY